MQYNDNHVFGESISPDRPQDGNGGFSNLKDKFGLMLGTAARGGKDQHLTSPSKRPHHKIKADATWGGRTVLHRNTFEGFTGTTELGFKTSTFGLNPYSADHIPLMEAWDTTFIDVADDGFGYFNDPSPGWANVKDCGNFPCTAPWNILASFRRSKFSGIQPLKQGPDFQLIPDNTEFSPYVPECSFLEPNNMWFCRQSKLSILMFESEDVDKRDRSMQPIYVQMQGTEMNSKLNAFMDHVWDGFYTGQVRESRFPALVYAPKGSVYNLTYTGSPAKKQRFELKSQDSAAGMTVRIAYPSAESRKIIKDGVVVDMN